MRPKLQNCSRNHPIFWTDVPFFSNIARISWHNEVTSNQFISYNPGILNGANDPAFVRWYRLWACNEKAFSQILIAEPTDRCWSACRMRRLRVGLGLKRRSFTATHRISRHETRPQSAVHNQHCRVGNFPECIRSSSAKIPRLPAKFLQYAGFSDTSPIEFGKRNMLNNWMTKRISLAIAAFVLIWGSPESLAKDPGAVQGSTANVKPIKVYILMGQSNMLEMGRVSGDKEGSLQQAVRKGLYPYLVDGQGNWTERDDVRNVAVMGSGGPEKFQVRKNDWLKVAGGKIGVEIGIGHEMGQHHEEPVLLLKSAIGNRSLGWDLLPPGSPSYEFTDPKDGKTYIYAGFGESPLRWEKGTDPEPIGWSAGLQYAGDVARAKKVLDDLGKFYPDADGYEVAGFFWWQGDKDRYNAGHAQRYELNLVKLINALRKDFNAPNAKFVCATLGQTDKDAASGNEKDIIEAQFAIADPAKHPELDGQVATVYTHPLSKGGASNGHYGGNAETYMNVGQAMGKAMAELQSKTGNE